jgi:hypothetical protein
VIAKWLARMVNALPHVAERLTNAFNPLSHVHYHRQWVVVGSLALLSFGIAYVQYVVRGELSRRFASFEFARTAGRAINIFDEWRADGRFAAQFAIVLDFFFLLFFGLLFSYFSFWAANSILGGPEERPEKVVWLAAIGVVIGWIALLAMLAGWFENGAMLVTITALGKQKDPKTIYFTALLATIKYVGFSIAIAFLLFRFEYFIYDICDQLAPFIAKWIGATLLLLATGIAGLRMLRASASLYPSLMMLHLAPSIPAANRVLARWGSKQQATARSANAENALFALLYGEMLAIFAFRLADWLKLHSSLRLAPWWFATGRAVGWFALLAATCHVVQNCCAEAALRQRRMGWWLDVCKAGGAVRVLLLSLAGGWFGLLLFSGELWLAGTALRWIKSLTAASSWPSWHLF